jgi:hypothetical protein
MLASAGKLRLDQGVERGEQCVGTQVVIDVDLVAVDQLALHGDQADAHLGATDVDGEHHFGERLGRGRGRLRIARLVGCGRCGHASADATRRLPG